MRVLLKGMSRAKLLTHAAEQAHAMGPECHQLASRLEKQVRSSVVSQDELLVSIRSADECDDIGKGEVETAQSLVAAAGEVAYQTRQNDKELEAAPLRFTYTQVYIYS